MQQGPSRMQPLRRARAVLASWTTSLSCSLSRDDTNSERQRHGMVKVSPFFYQCAHNCQEKTWRPWRKKAGLQNGMDHE
jgi:hypothetical protein